MHGGEIKQSWNSKIKLGAAIDVQTTLPKALSPHTKGIFHINIYNYEGIFGYNTYDFFIFVFKNK